MKIIKKSFLIILLFLALITFSMKIMCIFCDEIWEYGFAYNIYSGLIPYRDFNMVVTPLYPLIASLFIKIFGPYLLSVHILNTILLIISISIIYKLVGNKTLIIVPFLLLADHIKTPTYNGLILLLFLLLLYVKNTNIKETKKIILSGIIIGLILSTKQSIGIVFFILELILTNNKRIYLLSSSLIIFILLIYLIINKALYDFINYSILGLFDFATNNSNLKIGFIFFIIMVIILIILYKKHKDNLIIYTLAFLSICIPIFDFNHDIMGFSMFLIPIIKYIKVAQFRIKYFIIWSNIFLIFTLHYINIGVYINNNYLLGRNLGDKKLITVLENTSNKIDEYNKKSDKVFFISFEAPYFVKLYRKDRIDKYDLTLTGNLGYKGTEKYIKEIDNYCLNHKCIFILDKNNKTDLQLNRKIINHLADKYQHLENTRYFYVYANYN